MRKTKVIRLVEDSPQGPGFIVRDGETETFLSADRAAMLLGQLHYIVVTPISFNLTVEDARQVEEEKQIGPIRISKSELSVDMEALATPAGRKQFAEVMLKYPEIRKLLHVRRRPDGEFEFKNFDEKDPGEL